MKPQLCRINNHVREAENPSDKQADKGGIVFIRNIGENGIWVKNFHGKKNGMLRHTEFYGGQSLVWKSVLGIRWE